LGLLGVLLLSSCRPKKKHQLELYTSSDGGFSILLPGKPELSTKNQMTVFGNQTVHYIKWKLGSMDIYKLRVIEISYMNCGRQFTYDSLHRNRSLDTAVKTRLRDFTERAVHIENVDYNG